MITIKLPYKSNDKFQFKLSKLRQQYSCVVRFAFNRFIEGKLQKDIRLLCKSLNNIELLDSWLVQCAIMEAAHMYDRNKNNPTIVFGGKSRFINLMKSKLTKEEFKQSRLLPLTIQGEIPKNGNRKFKLNVIDDNSIMFKLNLREHFTLHLPKLRSNYKRELYRLEELNNISSGQLGCAYQIKLTETHIFITFKQTTNVVSCNVNRVMGIDLNPDNIGVSVSDWKSGNQEIIDTKYYNLSKITNKILSLGVASDDQVLKYWMNKQNHEIYEISKSITSLAKHYQCRAVVIEDLKFDKNLSNKYNHTGNRKCKNLWKRNKFIDNLKKRLQITGINLISIHPAYTSLIGNLIYDYPDSINASLEIARRGYEYKILKKKNSFYPALHAGLVKHQWKEMVTNNVATWKELYKQIKNSKLKYRVQLTDISPFSCFSLNQCGRSMILHYTFY